jgi:two-component system, NarL family, sensor kinase
MSMMFIWQTSIGGNEAIISIIAGFVMFFLICLFLLFFINKYYKNQQTFLLEKNKYNKQLLEVQVEVREEILQHVSREIHDNLGQITSLIKINLQMTALEKDPEKGKQILKETADLVKKLASDMKELSVSLRSDFVMENDFATSLTHEVNRLNKMGFVKVEHYHQGEEVVLESNTSLFLYRIFQEMVNNTMKHAKASAIIISTSYHPPFFVLTYKDNGIGFRYEENSVSVNGNSGLKNMKERCKLIGADFNMKSIPQLGTEIIIKLETKDEG